MTLNVCIDFIRYFTTDAALVLGLVSEGYAINKFYIHLMSKKVSPNYIMISLLKYKINRNNDQKQNILIIYKQTL